MHSQQLDKLIEIQQHQVSKGRSGGIVKNWGVFLPSVYAAVRHLSGNERQATSAAGGQVAVARTEFRIRFRPGITGLMRIKHGEAIYNIDHVNPLNEGGDWLILTSYTGVNNG
ncbi:phage head-tail adaptor, putative, SPP1 family [Polaromonas sp. OV174]|uniref:head-tail adaptor protein n=1 Tax=Polaromonas sp. OV174 TaxID=1855300 RepID=UPI0008F3CB86|nr:head-tail adaptor protein [Polaromonas sp. OV174]SFB96614.1 phage head-tail adaptor, putative, SPP1 family [Polaromonas sp. OV174]